MTSKTQNKRTTSNKLLTPKNISQLNDIAQNESGLFANRAAALLLIHDGMSQSQVAEKVDLSRGQISYLVRTFRGKGMAMFPSDTINEKVNKKTTPIKEKKAEITSKEEKKKDKKKKKKSEKKKKSVKKEKPKKKTGKKKEKIKAKKKKKKTQKKKKKK